MRALRWLADAIWVYLIPIVIVMNVVQPPLAYLLLGVLGLVAASIVVVVIFTVLIGVRVLLSLTRRPQETPEQRG
jgi:hypothetical protein